MSESIGAGSPASSRTAANERVVAIESLDWLRSLEGAWHRLLLASPTATAFASPAWVLTWYEHFQPRGGVYAVTVWRRRAGGLAPFARTRLGGAGPTLLVRGHRARRLRRPAPGRPGAGRGHRRPPRPPVHHDTAVNLGAVRGRPAVAARGRDDVACAPMGAGGERIVRHRPRLPRRSTGWPASGPALPAAQAEVAHGEISFAAVDNAHALRMRSRPALGPGEGPRLPARPGSLHARRRHRAVRSGLGCHTCRSGDGSSA